MVDSEEDSAMCDSTGEGNAKSRPLWARGGRCFVGFLEGTFQGKNTPVPSRGSFRGFKTIGVIGANITIGARRIPHLGIISIASCPLRAPFDKAYEVETPGCQRVIAFVIAGVGD